MSKENNNDVELFGLSDALGHLSHKYKLSSIDSKRIFLTIEDEINVLEETEQVWIEQRMKHMNYQIEKKRLSQNPFTESILTKIMESKQGFENTSKLYLRL